MDPRLFEHTPTDSTVATPRGEERRARRRPVEVACEVVSHYGDVPEQRIARDLSRVGMWIGTAMPLHPGAEVVVSFSSKGGRELHLFATVTRIVTGRRKRDRGPAGMAVEFGEMTAEERALVASCVDEVAAA